ncbi:MAG: hypothetical protein QXI11_02025 [Thermoproteota archaeon]
MTVREKVVEYVLDLLGKVGRIYIPTLIHWVMIDFGLKKKTVVDILKSLEGSGVIKVSGNYVILQEKVEKKVEEEEKRKEETLLNYLQDIQKKDVANTESGSQILAMQQAKDVGEHYLVIWDIDTDKVSEVDRVRRWRKLRKLLSEAEKKGKQYEKVNLTAILVNDKNMALQIASIYEDVAKVKVFKIVEKL